MASRRHRAEDEQEVKIRLSRGDLEKVFNALNHDYKPGYLDRKYMPRHYYDTPDLLLDQNDISVRLQYKEGKENAVGGYEQTVKFEIPHATTLAKGASLRREIKDPRPDHTPSLAIVKEAHAKAMLKPFVRRKLQHIFTAAIERRYFEVEIGRGRKKGTVEVAFDVGEIILQQNGRHYPFYEIEIERKKGPAEAVDVLREGVMAIAKSARIQLQSKGRQGSIRHRQATAHLKRQP